MTKGGMGSPVYLPKIKNPIPLHLKQWGSKPQGHATPLKIIFKFDSLGGFYKNSGGFVKGLSPHTPEPEEWRGNSGLQVNIETFRELWNE